MIAPEPIAAPGRSERLAGALRRRAGALARVPDMVCEGRLRRMVGLTLEAVGCVAPVGARCRVMVASGSPVETEVVGFDAGRLFLMPVEDATGLLPGSPVRPGRPASRVPCGAGLLGRVIDALGRPLDDLGGLGGVHWETAVNGPINPLRRAPVTEALDVGVRAINALLCPGRGQRLGLMAGTGVGKSVLLGMMTRFTAADVTVVGLIGERGREVREFVQDILGPVGLQRAVVIAAPADAPPLQRLQGAFMASRIAEGFRAQGLDVLLLMDSLTRFCQAQREIALAVGEPPASRGYPPSVFARLPRLVERAGNGPEGEGSITAFYTVLVESDDQQDPVADACRAILDGHVVLSRRLAEQGVFPAIDVEASVSRVLPNVAGPRQQEAVRRFRQLSATYDQHRDLISVGAYRTGTDPRVDEAVEAHERLLDFLRQDMRQRESLEDSRAALLKLLRPQSGRSVTLQG